MLKIGITGIDGMIGWHLHVFMHGQENYQVIGAGRAAFSSVSALDTFVSKSDILVHLAGMNRGDEVEIEFINVELARSIISACERTNARPHIIFSSSTHNEQDTAYGRSKRECAKIFKQWADKNGTIFSNLILPHVYGESGKPYYNSVVSTFCYKLANKEVPEILDDGSLELVHAQQVARSISDIIYSQSGGDIHISGIPIKVSGLLDRLKRIDKMYRSQLLPNVINEFDLYLFNTYKSYMFPDYYPVHLKIHQDNRGALFEAVKTNNGGQCFISTTKPGITRGDHYHTKKIERFLVLHGNALIRIRKLFSNKVIEYEVSGSRPQYVDIPTLHTHNIGNIGESDMTTLFWSNEIFDSTDTDTFTEKV